MAISGGSSPDVWFAYGQADQSVFRSMYQQMDGIVVPGTIATYFREATGGFILSLDAPYIIDPRTPLLQYAVAVSDVRPSHRTLASAHGEAFRERLGEAAAPRLTESDLWKDASRHVAAFQSEFVTDSSTRVARYAELLSEPVPAQLGHPKWILPAYLMADGPGATGDEWRLTLLMHEAAREVYGGARVAGVIASSGHLSLASHLADLGEYGPPITFIWLDDMRETQLSRDAVAELAHAVQQANGQRLFNLYGGYLSLVLSHFGLTGMASGVGYSESRNAAALAQSGAVRPRYYQPHLHAFLNPDVAELIMRRADGRLDCPCAICQRPGVDGQMVSRLGLRELLQHFVYSRQFERVAVSSSTLEELIAEMRDDASYIDNLLRVLPPRLRVPFTHLREWSSGLALAAGV